jgi:membrane protease YdiL (CAAX protease family)
VSVASLVSASTDVLRPESLARLWTSIWRLATTRDVVLLQGRQGNWRWPHALGSTVLACVCIVLLLVIVVGIAHGFNVVFKEDKPLDPQQPASFLLMLFMFLPFILVPSLLMRYLHQVSWWQVLGFSGRFDWRLHLRAAGAFFTTAAILFAIDYPIHPNAYRLLPHALDHTFWLVLGLAVIFVQTLAEEIMFRGYLLRIWGAVVPFRLLTPAIVMSAFISLHLSNADIKSDFWFNLIGFALTQAVWCYVWFRTQSTAASAGLHWANNVMAFFVVATVPGQSTSMALASFTDPLLLRGGSHILDPYAWFGMLLGLSLIVVLLLWRRSPFYLPFRSCAVSVTASPGLLNHADESGKGPKLQRSLAVSPDLALRVMV